MTAEDLWKEYARKAGITHMEYEAWAFGDAADELAALTARGIKTATSSAFPLYEAEREPLPEAGEYSDPGQPGAGCLRDQDGKSLSDSFPGSR